MLDVRIKGLGVIIREVEMSEVFKVADGGWHRLCKVQVKEGDRGDGATIAFDSNPIAMGN